MKNIFRIAFCLLLLFIMSCESDDTANVSFVTTYPVITIEGETIYTTPLGEPYTDPGATATIDDEEVDLTVNGTVDTSTPGVYPIVYSATNDDGFSRFAGRQVVVYDPATDDVDLTGSYIRRATGVTVTVEKIAPSTYFINDAAGFGASFLDVVFINTDGDNLVIPLQTAPSSGITVTTVPGTGKINDNGFQWVLNASSTYGTALRVFEKL